MAGLLGQTGATTTGVSARIGGKITENPARRLGERMGVS